MSPCFKIESLFCHDGSFQPPDRLLSSFDLFLCPLPCGPGAGERPEASPPAAASHGTGRKSISISPALASPFPLRAPILSGTGFFKDVILADHGAVSSAVLLSLPLRKNVSLKVGPQFTWYGSAFESWHNRSDRLGHALGPVVELGYQISERFRAFVDVAAGIGLEEQGVRTTNTGLGVAYRFKEEQRRVQLLPAQ